MLTLRRAGERRRIRDQGQQAWLTFFPGDKAAALAHGFGVLVILTEARLAPNASVPLESVPGTEVVTYVLEGAIAYQDVTGRTGVVQAGEFRRMTAGHRIGYQETNALPTDWVHVFQIGLSGSEDRPPNGEQKRFMLAERKGVLCMIASQDGRKASLLVHEDAAIFSAVLEPGQHVAHDLLPGRGAWVHVVRGEVIVGDAVLSAGDGAGITGERVVSLRARAPSEVLLVDLGMPLSAT